jgi:hypothetical protein
MFLWRMYRFTDKHQGLHGLVFGYDPSVLAPILAVDRIWFI